MTTLYERVMDGKRVRYVPVSEREQWDSWPEGHYLVHVKPGSRSSRSRTLPSLPHVCNSHIGVQDVMSMTSKRPKRVLITSEQSDSSTAKNNTRVRPRQQPMTKQSRWKHC